jgi:hypothetical protein
LTAYAGGVQFRDVPHADRPHPKPRGACLLLVHGGKAGTGAGAGRRHEAKETLQAGPGAAAANLWGHVATALRWIAADPRRVLAALGCAALLGAALSPTEER